MPRPLRTLLPLPLLLALLLFAPLLPSAAAAGEFAASAARCDAWSALGERDDLVITRLDDGRPATLLVDGPHTPAGGSERSPAPLDLEPLLPLFYEGDPAELVPDAPVSTAAGTVFTLRREVDGRPVFRAALRLFRAADGTLRLVSAHLPEGAPSASRAALSADDAKTVAGAALLARLGPLRGAGGHAPSCDEPVSGFFPLRGELLPAWRVEAAIEKPVPAERRYYVSAVDGTILAENDRLFSGAIPNHAGVARVYPTDPLGDAPAVVEIDRLTMADRLMGEYFYVTNSKTAAAVAPDRRFVYEVDDTHFDEANVYHHFERVRKYFSGEHAFGSLETLLTVSVHYGDKYDNAFWSPRYKKFAFGDGDRFNDFAKDAGIVYHEYTHAVTGTMAPDLYGTEAGGMHEAWSDYFAAVLTGNPAQGAWIVRKVGLPHMRTLENAKRYPGDMTDEIHLASEIYSGALWDLRKRMDRAACDRLVHASRACLSGPATYADGLCAMIAADLSLHGGRHRETILKAFAARGILLDRHVPRRFPLE